MTRKLNTFFIILTWLSLTLASNAIVAQIMEPIRLEIPARIDLPAYRMEILGEKGILVYYESTEVNNEGKRKWFFSLLDTNLREVWLQYVFVSDGLVCHSAHTSPVASTFLFTTAEAKKNTPPIYELLKFDVNTSHFVMISGPLPEKSIIKDFAIIGNKVMMAINLPRNETDLLVYDLDAGAINKITLGIEGQTIMQNIIGFEDNKRFVVGLKRFENNRFVEDIFLVADENGQIEKKWIFNDAKYYLHSMTFFLDSSSSLIVSGSYDLDSKRRTALRDVLNDNEMNFEAKGLFFLHFDKQGNAVSQFHDFSTFSNIYKNLPTEELIRTRQRMLRSRDERPENQVAFKLYSPKLMKLGKHYVYTAEAYKLLYRIETRMDYDFYGRLVPYSYSIFDGYQFFTALVTAFSSTGQMVWSNNFELRDLVTKQLQKNVSFNSDSSEMVATVVQGGLLTSKIITEDGKQLGQLEQSKIESMYTGDRLLEANYSVIEKWYANYFVVSGYQRISNNRLRTNNPRTVFFMQKLILE